MSRVIIHENSAPALPGTCILCMSAGGDHRKFIDFGKKLVKHGRVYFCEFCFQEINDALGWVSPANFEKVLVAEIEAKEEIEKLKEENAKLRSLVSGSIDQLRTDLSSLSIQPETVKRSPGRPKKVESGTS